MPYCLYPLTTYSEPGMAVAADRNPWIESPAARGKVDMYVVFNPDGDRDAVKAGNALAHQEEGQNVLFLDGHVSFEDHPFCGVNDDNIYTFWTGGDIRRGGMPLPGACEPADRLDSFLVHDPPAYTRTTTKQPEAINSADLKQTSVVATLDCPVPEHRNTIWCSTFQMAWDRLKNDIIGEPVEVLGAGELAARLNRAKVSETDLEPESFYATAGSVPDGIIEEIQNEIAERFPSEPVPVFIERYRMLPQPAIVAYSYLNVDVGFKYPFYTKDTAFSFEDSNGTRTDVTSFSNYTTGDDTNVSRVREQVEILYYKYGEQGSSDEFAVDLCKDTQPYQVILALVPRFSTLGEVMAAVEEKMAEFKHDPDYEVLRRLRPIDRLIVPDVLYKLKHHFTGLEGKGLGNRPWRDEGYLIFEAMQMIDFALSRTGVTVKSWGGIVAAPFATRPRPIEEPRHLYFNKPFLAYVKKRGPDRSPFFVMWVDNAELMKEF
jgi:prepilin-type processing-associated H-X9-DG protein